jgi:hypothetical protein
MNPKPDSHPQGESLLGVFLSPIDPADGRFRSVWLLLSVLGGCEGSLVEEVVA